MSDADADGRKPPTTKNGDGGKPGKPIEDGAADYSTETEAQRKKRFDALYAKRYNSDASTPEERAAQAQGARNLQVEENLDRMVMDPSAADRRYGKRAQ